MKLRLLYLCLCIGITLHAQQDPTVDLEDIACKEADAHEHTILPLRAENPLTENYDLKYYRFNWYIDPAVKYIRGTATVYFQTLEDNFNTIYFDLSSTLGIDSIIYHGQSLTYTQENGDLLEINLPSALNAGTLDSLLIGYAGAPPSNGLGSFEQNTHAGTPIIWTLSEPYGSKDWWPCKNGLTDKIDSIDVIITTPEAYRAASNGKLVEEYAVGTDKVYHWQHRYPITSYLVAIAVTNYVQYTDTVHLGNGTALPMVNYIYPENLANFQPATADLVQVLEFYDSLFVTYPYSTEKYGHAQFGWGGGEEHQTMSFVAGYNWSLLSHELAHQWFGDLVTCGSWEDIWLNEGFATYLEGMSRERFQTPQDWYSWKSGKVSNITAQSSGSVKVTDTTNVNRIFNSRLSYSKGSYLLHMLRWKLGEDAFFQGLRNYLEDHAYGYAKTIDLQQHLEATSGQDLSGFFADWFVGQGYPSFSLTWQQKDNKLLLQLDQTPSHASVSFFELPVPVRVSGVGIDTMLRLEHTEHDQIYSIPISFEATSLEIDPDLWLISRNNTVQQGEVSATHDLAPGVSALLYPNPAQDVLNLSIDGLSSSARVSWTLVNSIGVSLEAGLAEHGRSSINIADMSSGMYWLLIRDDRGGSHAIAFVKD